MSTLDLRVGGVDIDFDLIKVNGSYVKKWEMTINPNNELGISWSFDPATYANDFTYSNTRDTREDLNGYFGTMTMWSPADNPLHDRLDIALAGIDKDYGVDSGGAYYPLNSVTRTGQSISMVQFGKYESLWSGTGSLSQVRQNMPRPTFYVSGNNVNEVTTLTENVTQTWPEWSSFNGETGYHALQNYTVYKKPYIPDTTLSLHSNSTQHQYNGGVVIPSSITLSQPETFAAVSLIRIDGTVEPLASYSSFYALHQHANFGSHRFALCIRAYAPHWDQDSDISISWSITGAGAPHVNEKGTDATSGTITNFQPIPTTAYGYTSAMSNYRYGYTEVYADSLPIGSGGLETFEWDFNIVPNGLKLHSASTSTVNLSGIL